MSQGDKGEKELGSEDDTVISPQDENIISGQVRKSERQAVIASRRDAMQLVERHDETPPRREKKHRARKSKAVVSSDEEEVEVIQGKTDNPENAAILEALDRDGFVLLDYEKFRTNRRALEPAVRRHVHSSVFEIDTVRFLR